MLTLNVAVLLAIIVIVRWRRPVEPRTRADQMFGITIILVLGLLLAPTAFGHSVLGAVKQLVEGIARASH
ncbi:hypothetical protein YWIDRAFT_08200 [Streptomyces sp. SceaMP-e96]|uniref:hypothetical protein n=1 Tax=unclassified Streptomyces TaxID=2593676 RepID=UPI0008238938|nr:MULTISPECIES: hypothetical protein [unclassified Streptomyces]MYT18475.1 hypothetical protein [Streptomyces sp. SID4951]SCK56987.1 hypothetical protein YWIDRAFT_08200 [Streptomyces sp. SceaMP-e96]